MRAPSWPAPSFENVPFFLALAGSSMASFVKLVAKCSYMDIRRGFLSMNISQDLDQLLISDPQTHGNHDPSLPIFVQKRCG